MSSPDQSKGGRSRDEVLAGEYVLGVLSLADRQKVEARMRDDRPFAAIVTRWEQNLSSFNDEYEAVLPPATVFPKIEKRIFGDRPQTRSGVWNSLLISRIIRASSSSLASARIAKPVRTCPALKSIDPIVHAVVSILSTVGLIAGVRALPDLSLSMLRASSPVSRDLSTSKCLMMAAKSPELESSSLVRKCSTSMS